MALAEALARRVEQHGGAALIIDYGQDAPYESSLQAIRRHAFVPLLQAPGIADISNRVDFSALRWGRVARWRECVRTGRSVSCHSFCWVFVRVRRCCCRCCRMLGA
jgi:hypothetical protein